MDDTREIENINRCAVRISDESGENLFGSGILYLAIENQIVLVFTAAHVIDNMNLSHSDHKKRIKIAFKDSKDEVKTIDIDCRIVSSDKADIEVGDIYVHNDHIKGEFIKDVAIVCVPKEEWMRELKSYQISDCTLSDRQIGYGFPESSDDEASKESNTILGGKSKLECDVVDKHTTRYVLEYRNKMVYNMEISREQIMKGFSGTGLFSKQNGRYKLCGILSSPYAREKAGNQAYAIRANLLFDIMEQHNLKIEIPKSFKLHRELIRHEYNKRLAYDTERDTFDYFADDLIQNKGLIPQKVFEDGYEDIKCKQQKIGCEDYWIGQLKKSVVLAKLKDVPVDNMKCPYIKLPEPYSEYTVNIKFLCSDEEFVTVIRNLIDYDYFNNGVINNNTIILWNNHRDNTGNINIYSREKFRKAMRSIVGSKKDKYSASEMTKKLSRVTKPNKGIVTFDIIEGDISECNLALIGTNRMMESIEDLTNSQNLEEMKNKFDEQLKEIWRD